MPTANKVPRLTLMEPKGVAGLGPGFLGERTSTRSLLIQGYLFRALPAASLCKNPRVTYLVRSEKVTGSTRQGRSELASIITFLHPGDELVVTRIDRLARSIGDLQDIVREMRAKGASLRATEQPIDTSTAAGKAFLDMLGVFAEFETNLRRERQLEGIAKAKEAGVYKGGTRRIDREAVQSLHRDGKGPSEIAKALGISRMHAYRLIKAMEAVARGAAA